MPSFVKRSPRARRSRLRPLISCEHGGNAVPAEYARLFRGAAGLLDSHRGLDFGALEMAAALGTRLGVQPITATTTRLVVDLNRSPHARTVFSDYTRVLSAADRAVIMDRYYWPYRSAVERKVQGAIARGGTVVHIASHSFTPMLKGKARNCDVGLLYDPRRPGERRFVDAWRAELAARAPQLRVRRNYPYRGDSDALVTHLRRLHGPRRYLGLELEVNQMHVGSRSWHEILAAVGDALAVALERG